MENLRYDPEFWQVFEPMAGYPVPTFDDPVAARTATEKTLGELFKQVPRPAGVAETSYEVESLDGFKIPVTRFVPSALKDVTKPQRAVIYLHGGWMVMGSVELFKPLVLNYAHNYNIQIFGVDYRLGPEDPAPAGVEDTYAVVKWLQNRADEFNIDPARIALFGASAGGGVAVGASLFARDKGLSPPLARLVIIYPMLDDRTSLDPENVLTKYVGPSDSLNKLGWKAYLGGRERDERDDVSIYMSPGRAENLEGLPPTYVDIGGFDLFASECVEFVRKLTAANNSVEFHLYPGVPHGWEGIAPLIRASKQAAENRKRVLGDF
ncbi:triacylglycerol lipase [Truncatella angustata]|uniref:Triacylglycerol lipase n=1 Tax=Truncatella angustata TaxID=152316 RepID=A0A9P8ULY2_9PEZI|nr:triacylglycerol lipase [Truncatella angustata]KAH6654397.1 triacylglycerol lipase [Truncatella angustata]